MSREERFHIQETIQSRIGYALVDTALLDPAIVSRSLRDKPVYETAIFRITYSGVDYCNEVDSQITYSEEDASAAHKAMIDKWRI